MFESILGILFSIILYIVVGVVVGCLMIDE